MKKNADIEIIARLAKSINRELQPLKIDKMKSYSKNGYCLDASGRVVGLNLNKNKGLDCSLLQDLTHLNLLTLYECSLTDISPLASLTALKEVDLRHNPVVDISPLSSLAALTKLSLNGNQIMDVSPLAPLTSLNTLYLYNNQIMDVSPLNPGPVLYFFTFFAHPFQTCYRIQLQHLHHSFVVSNTSRTFCSTAGTSQTIFRWYLEE